MDAYVFTLDLIPLKKITPVITASQYDVGRPFLAHIQYNEQDYEIPAGATVQVNGKKRDNNIFSYEASFSGSDVYFETEEQMTPCDGFVEMEISIVLGGTKIGSANFKMHVETSVLEGGVDSETAIDWVEQTRNNAAAAATSAAQAEAAVNSINLSDLAAPTITASTAAFPALATGDTGKVLIGKIQKWFSDIRNTFLQNNATTTETGYALDARMGKTLQDQITSLNSRYTTLTNISDLNDDTLENGLYVYPSSASNKPGSASGIILCLVRGTNITQLAFQSSTGQAFIFFARTRNTTAESWPAWTRVI